MNEEIKRMEATYSLEQVKKMAADKGLPTTGTKRDIITWLVTGEIRKPSEIGGGSFVKDLPTTIDKLTKYDLYKLDNELYGKLENPIYFRSGATKKDMLATILRWWPRSGYEDRIVLIQYIQSKVKEKEQYPVRGEVPGTRYLKWSDFIKLPSYNLISRAVHYPHSYKRKCDPQTKDGYLSVHAIYNMSEWANWKSSSLDPREMAIAKEINKLPLYDLMMLNKGRRMDQPALLPQKMLPL